MAEILMSHFVEKIQVDVVQSKHDDSIGIYNLFVILWYVSQRLVPSFFGSVNLKMACYCRVVFFNEVRQQAILLIMATPSCGF
jgi:hypothetical protein